MPTIIHKIILAKKKLFLLSFLILHYVFLIPNWANAQYTILHNFEGNPDGSSPYGSLISDGTFLYGTTYLSGSNGLGTIFKIMPDGSGYLKLLDFAGATNGSYPAGSLIYDGTFLYGITVLGGVNNIGTIFKIMPDGSGYVKLLDFDETIGAEPTGSLVYDGTFLYGMATGGGTNDLGTVYKIMPDGSGFVKLLDFAGIANGSLPFGSLITDGSWFYGMTYSGGANDLGTIFKISPGSGYVKLLDFAGATNGNYPPGSLMYDGTFLYGMTSAGGTFDRGTIFKIMTDGSGYVKLLDFSGTANGGIPQGSLISDGTFLYGMTFKGGLSDLGTLFKIMPDGSGYVKQLDFAGITNGNYPYGDLISDGNFLYGMTHYGGANNVGTIFKYEYAPIGIQENNTQTSINVYPNPTEGAVNIVCAKQQKDATLEIMNIVGQKVMCIKNINLSAGEINLIDLSSFSDGVYILRLNNFSKTIVKS